MLTSLPAWYSWVRLFVSVFDGWVGGLEEREVIERACPLRVCVLFKDGGWGGGGGVWRAYRAYRVYMKHHYHIKDTLGSLS